MVRPRTDRIDEWWNPSVSIVRFDEASLGRDAPRTNRTRGKAREKTNRLPNGEVSLDNADAVIDALQRPNHPGTPVARLLNQKGIVRAVAATAAANLDFLANVC